MSFTPLFMGTNAIEVTLAGSCGGGKCKDIRQRESSWQPGGKVGNFWARTYQRCSAMARDRRSPVSGLERLEFSDEDGEIVAKGEMNWLE